MLTIFTTPKAFRGHFGVIQRNAILSWTRMKPHPEIILFGNEDGSHEFAKEAGIRHITDVVRNEYGTPLVSGLFDQAQTLATNAFLCYVNADIVLPKDFSDTIQRVASWSKNFLLIGRRFNVNLDQPEIYDSAENEERLISLVKSQNQPFCAGALDYFIFPRGQYKDILPFAIGRGYWDNWLLWRTRSLGIPVVDASEVILAIHQNHDYSYGTVPGEKSIYDGEEIKRNLALAAGRGYTFDDITHRVNLRGIRPDFRNRFLKHSRSMRRRLGLSRENLDTLKSAVRSLRKGQPSAMGDSK
jgi:hypothetical protein